MILKDDEVIFSVRTNEGVKRCAGVPVVIEGFEQFQFMADDRYDAPDDDKDIYYLTVYISELSTGYAVAWDDDYNEAIEKTKNILVTKGLDAFVARMAEVKAEFGTLNEGGAQ